MRMDAENILKTLNKIVLKIDSDFSSEDGASLAYEFGKKLCFKNVSKKKFLYILTGFRFGFSQCLLFEGNINAMYELVSLNEPQLENYSNSCVIKFIEKNVVYSQISERLMKLNENSSGSIFVLNRIYQNYVSMGAASAALLSKVYSNEHAHLLSDLFQSFVKGAYDG